jgi:hypothetical protein
MRTSEAVTHANGIPVGYGTLAAAYVAVACGVVWILRRLARAPLDGPGDPLGLEGPAEPQPTGA